MLLSYLATTTGWSDSFRNAGRIASGMLVGFKSELRSVSRRNGGRIHPEFASCKQLGHHRLVAGCY